MSNFDRAVEVLREAYREPSMSPVHACDIMADALEAAGLLAPDLKIIRTVEELEALDPDTALTLYTWKEATIWEASYLQKRFDDTGYIPDLPAVVIATGAQVRAAREALEQDNG